MQCVESGKRVAHHPAAALGHGDQALAQMRQALLDRETANAAALLPIAIPKICAGPVATEEFVLDMDREIADPAGESEVRTFFDPSYVEPGATSRMLTASARSTAIDGASRIRLIASMLSRATRWDLSTNGNSLSRRRATCSSTARP